MNMVGHQYVAVHGDFILIAVELEFIQINCIIVIAIETGLSVVSTLYDMLWDAR